MHNGTLKFETSPLCKSCRGFGIIGNEYDHEACQECGGYGIKALLLAEIEAAAVERAKECVSDAIRDWVFDQLDDEVLTALRDARVIACKDGYLMSMKADAQAVVWIALDEWAANRRKEVAK